MILIPEGHKPSISRLLSLLILTLLSLMAMPGQAYPQQKKVLIIGDSLSSAYNIKQSEGWVHLLAEKLKQEYPKYHVINAAISGDTSANALQQLPKKLAEHKPEIVVIEIGGNDGLRGFPIKKIAANIEQLVAMSIKSAQVMLVGIEIPPNYGKKYTDSFKQIYAKLADDYPVTYLPFLLEGVALDKSLMQADGIHPNAKAQTKILSNVWHYLRPMLRP